MTLGIRWSSKFGFADIEWARVVASTSVVVLLQLALKSFRVSGFGYRVVYNNCKRDCGVLFELVFSFGLFHIFQFL